MTELDNKFNKNDSIKIDINDIIRSLIKDFWLIIIFGLSVSMCAYIIINILHKPSYKTSATFVVTTKGSNEVYTNLAAANMVAETLTKVFSSTVLEDKVSEEIGFDKIPGTIDAQLITETNLFVLTVKSTSPYMAHKIIRSIMNNYTNVTGNIFGNAILDVLEAPEVPVHPDNDINNYKLMIIACLIGMAVMSGILAAMSITRDDIKNEDEIIQKLSTKLLGVVYHEKKNKAILPIPSSKKKSLLITSATVSFSFVECIKKIRAKYEYKASLSNSNLLLVTSVLENEGKSTIATNLALSLVKKGYNVLLVDADFIRPSVYKILHKNIQNNQEISECILSSKDIKDSLIYDESSGLYLLLGSKLFNNSLDLLLKESFKKLMAASKKIMDYVIIDAPPVTVSAHTEILADIADSSMLVVKQSTAPTNAVVDAVNLLSESKSEFLGCVYNNVHSSILGKNGSYNYNSYKYYYGHYEKKEAANN
jgi:capsular exopolysaccharide synthesis family protein